MTDLDLQTMRELCEVGFTKFSGCEVTLLEEGRAVGEMKISENQRNPLNTIHGGAVFTLADTIGGVATRTLGVNPTTCSSTINYMRPTIGCTKLIADAKVLKHGKTTTVVDISLLNQDEREVAHVLATYFDLGEMKPQNA